MKESASNSSKRAESPLSGSLSQAGVAAAQSSSQPSSIEKNPLTSRVPSPLQHQFGITTIFFDLISINPLKREPSKTALVKRDGLQNPSSKEDNKQYANTSRVRTDSLQKGMLSLFPTAYTTRESSFRNETTQH